MCLGAAGPRQALDDRIGFLDQHNAIRCAVLGDANGEVGPVGGERKAGCQLAPNRRAFRIAEGTKEQLQVFLLAGADKP